MTSDKINGPDVPSSQTARQAWLAILARADLTDLEDAVSDLKDRPEYHFDRAPEFGMVMSEGRAGGTGRRFNLGHVSITRTALRLKSGERGVGYCLGQNEKKAEYIALFDALLQTDQAALINEKLVAPLQQKQAEAREVSSQKSASSSVDFFTMVRGENADKNLRK